MSTFRAGVGVLILDNRGWALALERSDVTGAWQLPQGGIEGDEEPVDAMWRELREETGLSKAHVTLLAEVPEWLGYELPPDARSEKTGRGQVHKWFLLRSRDAEPPVVLDGADAEFRSWRWLAPADLAEQAVPFRQAVYRHLAGVVARLIGP